MPQQADQPVNLATSTGAGQSVKSASVPMSLSNQQQGIDNTLMNISAWRQNLSHMYTHHPNPHHAFTFKNQQIANTPYYLVKSFPEQKVIKQSDNWNIHKKSL